MNNNSIRNFIIFMVFTIIIVSAVVFMTPAPSKEITKKVKMEDLKDQKAPEFSLENYEGKKINLNDYKGKKVVLFFNEGLPCYPACWNQMAKFATDMRFNTDEVAVFSIVTDKKEDFKKAIDSMPDLGKATILFDTDKKISNDYGAFDASSSMHKGAQLGHTYLVLDKEGVVKYIYDDAGMGVKNDEIFAELQKIN